MYAHPKCRRRVQVLLDHEEEVWHLQFSHGGRHLASASKDGSAIIWEVTAPRRRLVKRHTLKGHTGPVVFVAWSPDDSKLATCGALTTQQYVAWHDTLRDVGT